MTPTHRETPVIMITSRAAQKHREKARQLGANDYLVKPFHDEHLLTLIGTLYLHYGSPYQIGFAPALYETLKLLTGSR